MRLSRTRQPSAKPPIRVSTLAAIANNHDGRDGRMPADANIGGVEGDASGDGDPADSSGEAGASVAAGEGALVTGVGTTAGTRLEAGALAAALAAFRALASSASSLVFSPRS